MSIARFMRKPLRHALAILSLICVSDIAFAKADEAEITVLSSRPDAISGGDAVIEVRLPNGVSTQQIVLLRNGVDVTDVMVPTNATTARGLVGGLPVGESVLSVGLRNSKRNLASLQVSNYPIYGPVFAGPHQRPWICETVASGLGAPQDEQRLVLSDKGKYLRAAS